jgi:hypothetical protein
VRFNYGRRLSTIQHEDIAARLLARAALDASIAIDRYLHEPVLLSSLFVPEMASNGHGKTHALLDSPVRIPQSGPYGETGRSCVPHGWFGFDIGALGRIIIDL